MAGYYGTVPYGVQAQPPATSAGSNGGTTDTFPQESLQQRSLWIGDIDVYVTEACLQAAFASYGVSNITNIRLIRDRVTGQPSGYGFVEFPSAQAATVALQACAGKPLTGMPGRTFRLNHASSTVGCTGAEADDFQAHISGLAPEITETLLFQIFRERYSTLRGVKLIIDPGTGASRGFAFARFGSEEERTRAIEELNGTHICGRPIRVTVAASRVLGTTPASSSASAAPSSAQSAPMSPAATAALCLSSHSPSFVCCAFLFCHVAVFSKTHFGWMGHRW